MKKYRFYIHHLLKEDLFYTGITSTPLWARFRNNQYKTTALFPYLDLNIPLMKNPNIETVYTEPLYTYDEAKFIEDWFITAFKPGKCINKQRSGLIRYDKNYVQAWRSTHTEQYRKANVVSKQKERSTPAGKIYNRVASYNYKHADNIFETPLEAKNKYLESGYIPLYVKHDDLVVHINTIIQRKVNVQADIGTSQVVRKAMIPEVH